MILDRNHPFPLRCSTTKRLWMQQRVRNQVAVATAKCLRARARGAVARTVMPHVVEDRRLQNARATHRGEYRLRPKARAAPKLVQGRPREREKEREKEKEKERQ